MNILLISPNRLQVPYPVYPIGLDYVAGAIGARHEVRIADLNMIDLDQLEQLLVTFAPHLIGISCRNLDNTDAGSPLQFIDGYRTLVGWLRNRTAAPIVCGGSGFTIMPEALVAALGVDYGIFGEGERFGTFIEAIETGEDPVDLPGVVIAGRPFSPPTPWNGEQTRAFAAGAGNYRYYLDHGGMLNLQSKRGCPFHCIYCSYPHIEGRRQRLQPAGQVAATARRLQDAGARYLFFTDSAFNADQQHSLAVAAAFRDAGISIPWGAFFAPLAPPPGYFEKLREAGLSHVEFGTESLADQVLKAYRKPFSSADVMSAHRQARQSGVYVAHYFLLGGPGESRETVNETLNRAEDLDRTVLFFFIGIRIYPNTALYDLARQEGKISADTDLLMPYYYETDTINRNEIETLVRHAARKRGNWLIGSGDGNVTDILRKLYERNRVGPLWEYLIR